MVIRYDFIPIKARVDSKTGWLRDRPVITRTGVFKYTTKAGKEVRELRTSEEVFKADSLVTIAGIPITVGHIGMLTANSNKPSIGTVISPGIPEETNVVADIIIHEPTKLGDRRELSLGYTCEIEETPGQTENGEHYDAIQKNIIYNHLAVVRTGRAGNARLRLDSTDAVSGLFEQENDMDIKLVPIRFDGLEYSASPEVLVKFTKLETDNTELRSKFDSLEAERDTLKASLEAEKAKVIEVSKTALDTAKNRVKLEMIADKHNVAHADSSDRDIKVAIVTKIRGDAIRFDGKSDDYVNSAFDLVISEQNDKDDKTGSQRKKLNERKDTSDIPEQSSQAARARMIARLRGEKKEAA